jgi:hypothetical protein
MSQIGDGLEMLVLVSQSLTGSKAAGMEIPSKSFLVGTSVVLELFRGKTSSLGLGLGICHLSVMGEQLLKVLGTKDANLGQKQFTLNERSSCVVEDSPDGHQVLELATGLLNDTVLALKDDGHTREIGNLGVADDERINVEATSGQNTRDAREHTGLVLNKTVEDMAFGRKLGG